LEVNLGNEDVLIPDSLDYAAVRYLYPMGLGSVNAPPPLVYTDSLALAGQPVVVQPVVVFKKFFFRMILSYKLQAAPSIKLQAQPEVVFNEYIFPDLPPLLYRII